MQLISERGINLHFYPMINARGRTYDSKTIKRKKNIPIFIAHKDSRWTFTCYKMMDFIASKFRLTFIKWFEENHGVDFPYANTALNLNIRHLLPILFKRDIFDILEKRDNTFTNNSVYGSSFSFSITELIKSGIFKNLSISNVDSILDTISSCRIKTNYKILSEGPSRDVHGNNKFDFHKYYSNIHKDYQTLFSYEKIEGKSTKYRIHFNSVISACFVHNVITGGFQIIEEPFYSLSQNANIFFRRRFFIFSKLPKCTIDLNAFNELLGFNHSNITVSKNRFKNVFEELHDHNLIKIIRKINDDKFEVSRNKIKEDKKVLEFKKKAK